MSRKEEDFDKLESLNDMLLEVLEQCYRILANGSYHAAPATTQAHIAINVAKQAKQARKS